MILPKINIIKPAFIWVACLLAASPFAKSDFYTPMVNVGLDSASWTALDCGRATARRRCGCARRPCRGMTRPRRGAFCVWACASCATANLTFRPNCAKAQPSKNSRPTSSNSGPNSSANGSNQEPCIPPSIKKTRSVNNFPLSDS
jgi:hypothetical protein